MFFEVINLLTLLDLFGFLPSRFFFIVNSYVISLSYIFIESSFLEKKTTQSQLHVFIASLCSFFFFLKTLSHNAVLLLLLLGSLWSKFSGFVVWSWDLIEIFSTSLMIFCFIMSHLSFSLTPALWLSTLYFQNSFRLLTKGSTHIIEVAGRPNLVELEVLSLCHVSSFYLLLTIRTPMTNYIPLNTRTKETRLFCSVSSHLFNCFRPRS